MASDDILIEKVNLEEAEGNGCYSFYLHEEQTGSCWAVPFRYGGTLYVGEIPVFPGKLCLTLTVNRIGELQLMAGKTPQDDVRLNGFGFFHPEKMFRLYHGDVLTVGGVDYTVQFKRFVAD